MSGIVLIIDGLCVVITGMSIEWISFPWLIGRLDDTLNVCPFVVVGRWRCAAFARVYWRRGALLCRASTALLSLSSSHSSIIGPFWDGFFHMTRVKLRELKALGPHSTFRSDGRPTGHLILTSYLSASVTDIDVSRG